MSCGYASMWQNTLPGSMRRSRSSSAISTSISMAIQNSERTLSSWRAYQAWGAHQALRNALDMPGLVARWHNEALRTFGDRLRLNGLAPKAVIGALMCKLAPLIASKPTTMRP